MAKINEKSNKTPGKLFITAMSSEPADELTTAAVPKRASFWLFFIHCFDTVA